MFLVSIALLASPAWELVDSQNALKVWTRDKPGSDYEEIRAEIVLDADFQSVCAVLDFVDGYVEFMPRLVEARVLERVGRVLYQYQKIDPPLLAERDSVMRIEIERKPGQTVRRFAAAAHPLAPAASEGTVRLRVLNGEWRVEALADGRTALSYQVHADPGGRVPSWLANYASTFAIPSLMEAFRDRVKALRSAKTNERSPSRP